MTEAKKDFLELLVEKAKAEGIELLEENAKILINVLFDTGIEYIQNDGKTDVKDMFLPVLPMVKKGLMDLAEGINKEDNE